MNAFGASNQGKRVSRTNVQVIRWRILPWTGDDRAGLRYGCVAGRGDEVLSVRNPPDVGQGPGTTRKRD